MDFTDACAKTEAQMRYALRQGNAFKYVFLCDELGIPLEARDPHLQQEVFLSRLSYPLTKKTLTNHPRDGSYSADRGQIKTSGLFSRRGVRKPWESRNSEELGRDGVWD